MSPSLGEKKLQVDIKGLERDAESAPSCCGGPAPEPGACCVRDAQVKAAGGAGCGCAPAQGPTAAGCC
jgi:hypothetical protein